MRKQIRGNVFETNSSSTHSITICSKKDFEKWKDGELIYDGDNDELVDLNAVNSDYLEEDIYKTYEQWQDDDYLEFYIENYKTESGDEIVAFGKYGYN